MLTTSIASTAMALMVTVTNADGVKENRVMLSPLTQKECQLWKMTFESEAKRHGDKLWCTWK